jgi:HlyD family secretion protein
MSRSMLIGRVVLPGIGLLLTAILCWQAGRSHLAARALAEPAPSGRVPAGSPSSTRIVTEGQVVAAPGAEVRVAAEVLGTIVLMPARESSRVRQGDLLVALRDDEVRASLREAQAHLAEAESVLRLERRRVGLARLLPLLAGRAPRPGGDPPELSASVARRDSARAEVERAEAEAAKYRILAPIDGVVVARHAVAGETVNPAAPLVTVVDLSRLRVEAEVDEFDIARVATGAEVAITAEGYSGRRWRGAIEEVGDVVVPRQTRPDDPGRPTDTRVLPVKVGFREANPLKLGQRVEVEIGGRERPR